MNDIPATSPTNGRPVNDKIMSSKQPRGDLLAVLAGLCETITSVHGERAMWRAVILQALLDAVSKSGKEEANRSRRDARRWLSSGEDFDEICLLAGFQPSYVRRKICNTLRDMGIPVAEDARTRRAPLQATPSGILPAGRVGRPVFFGSAKRPHAPQTISSVPVTPRFALITSTYLPITKPILQ